MEIPVSYPALIMYLDIGRWSILHDTVTIDNNQLSIILPAILLDYPRVCLDFYNLITHVYVSPIQL